MEARSPLSPKRTNLPYQSECSGKLARGSKVHINTAAGQTSEQPVGASPRNRRHATVSWLANLDAKQLEAQMETILGQHDENATAGRIQRSVKGGGRGKADYCSKEGKRIATNRAEARLESDEWEGFLTANSAQKEHGTGPEVELSFNDTERGELIEEPEIEQISLAEIARDAEVDGEAELDWGALPSEQEIEIYANYLGMRSKEDAELLWIAEQAMLCPVPDGWQEGVDSDGRTYFYEVETMTSCRAHPCDGDYMFLYKGLRRAVRDSAVPFEAVIMMADRLGIDVATEPHLLWIARHALLSPLLPGWEELEDEEGTYYYDRRKAESPPEHPIDAFFVRLIETERKKRKDAEKKDPEALALRDRKACVMELLDEDGDVYKFDWSQAEEEEPSTDDEDTLSNDRPSVGVWWKVAGFLRKAPSAVLGALSRSVSGLVEGQLLQVV